MNSKAPDLASRRHWAAPDRDQPAATRTDTIDDNLSLEEEMMQSDLQLEFMVLADLKRDLKKQIDLVTEKSEVVDRALAALAAFIHGDDLATLAKAQHAQPATVRRMADTLTKRARDAVDEFCVAVRGRIDIQRRYLESERRCSGLIRAEDDQSGVFQCSN